MAYIYGKNVIASYLDTKKIIEVYYAKEYQNHPLVNQIKQQKIPVIEKSKITLEQLANSDKHQGFVAKIKDFQYTDYAQMVRHALQKKRPVFLMLDGIEDPHNLGAIVRTVEAFQIDGIILKKNNSVAITPTVAKVSTGALAHVAICQVTNLSQTLQDLKQKGFWIYAAEASQGVNYQTLRYDAPMVLIMGSEGKGISRLVMEQADYRIFIPMYGKVNSLNLSVATAILLATIVNN